MNVNELMPQLKELKDEILRLIEKNNQQQSEIAELKHMNRNWQISEGMALAEIEALKDGLKAMVIEFRQLDLPYGSKAYTNATELLWKNNER